MFANWSIGAFVGAVTIGPLILAWHDNPGGFTLRRLIAFAALMAAVAVFAWSVFASSEIDNLRTWHILPMLVVASLTFGARGASTALLIIAAIAVWGTNAGVGQFNQMSVSPEQRMMLLQQFIGTITLTALILSVVTDERRMKDILAARQEFLRKAEQESRARAEELEVILGAVPVAVVIAHDPECRKMSTNQMGANALRIGPLLHFDRESSPYVRMLDATGRELPLGERPMHRAARGETLTDFAGKVVFDDGSTRDFLGAARPLHDPHGAVRGAVGAFLDTTERKKAEERITLLAREVDHRAKNVMAVVQAMARLTKADDIDSFRKAILGRIGNLARTHNLLAANLWEGVSFADLIRDEFAAYGLNGNESAGTGTLDAAGPDLQLHPGMAQSLALVIHELITNAIKYGALSVPAGQVGVEWRIEGDGDENLLLVDWREHNGPPVSPPQQPGFGSELMAGAIRHQLGGELDMDWSLAGLCVALRVPLRHQDPE
jgi:two-component sensor histidine kinase